MKRKIIGFAIAAVLLVTVLTIGAELLYNPSWRVTIDSSLSGLRDDFSLGVGKPASDSYDANDILKAPMAPGKSIVIQSVVNGIALQGDYRAELGLFKSTKIWQTTLIANDPNFVGISGAETLTWNLESVPRNVKLTLIDYGGDSSRKNVVKTIDMKKTSSYSFNVASGVGPYRYVDIKVTK